VKEDSLIEEGFDLFLFPGDAGFAFFLSVGTLEAHGGRVVNKDEGVSYFRQLRQKFGDKLLQGFGAFSRS